MLITTSRKPSRRTRSLGRDLERVLDGLYVTRGKANIETLVEKSRNQGHHRIVLIYDLHGNPGKLQSIVVREDSWDWHPLIINLSGVKLQREIGMKTRLPSLSVENETGHDVIDFFGLMVDDESRARMIVREDRITFQIGKKEVGPRLLVKEWYYATGPRD